MIQITRLNGSVVYLNADLVKSVEPTPDSVITLTTGEKVVARESAQVIVERIIEYQHMVHASPFLTTSGE